MRIVVFCLARATFDVELASRVATEALASLHADRRAEVLGDAELLLEPAQAAGTPARNSPTKQLDGVLILQASFCDAAMTTLIGKTLKAPVAVWAFPEPRDGDRLRLNSFCGLSLASHALGKAGLPCGWLHAPETQTPDLDALFAPRRGRAGAHDRGRTPRGAPSGGRRRSSLLERVGGGAAGGPCLPGPPRRHGRDGGLRRRRPPAVVLRARSLSGSVTRARGCADRASAPRADPRDRPRRAPGAR